MQIDNQNKRKIDYNKLLLTMSLGKKPCKELIANGEPSMYSFDP
jgi:hypothetical protein